MFRIKEIEKRKYRWMTLEQIKDYALASKQNVTIIWVSNHRSLKDKEIKVYKKELDKLKYSLMNKVGKWSRHYGDENPSFKDVVRNIESEGFQKFLYNKPSVHLRDKCNTISLITESEEWRDCD